MRLRWLLPVGVFVALSMLYVGFEMVALAQSVHVHVIVAPRIRCVPFNACIYGGKVIDPLEVVWTVITAIALTLTVLALWSSVLERRAARTGKHPDPFVNVMTKEAVYRDSIFVVIQALLFGLGVWAMFLPPPLVRVRHDASNGFAIIFMLFAVLLLFATGRSWLARHRLAAIVQREASGLSLPGESGLIVPGEDTGGA